MSIFNMKEFVCLVTNEQLEVHRQGQVSRSGSSLIRANLWRQIFISASSEGIGIKLADVPEEVVRTGYAQALYNCTDHKIGWEDLTDYDSLSTRFHFESVVVWKQIERMLGVLREYRVALHAALSA